MILLPLLCLLSPGFGPASAQDTRPNNMVPVSEGEDALLPCALSSGQNIEQFDWRKYNGEEEKKEVFMYNKGKYYGQGLKGQSEQFIGRVEFFKDEVASGNASIKIKNTRLEDNGTYICFLVEPSAQTGPKEFSRINLNVGASPLPYVKQVRKANSWRLLQCKVQGVPKPELEWRDSAGTALLLSSEDKHVMWSQDASGRFHVQLSVNVTRSDNYTCVATQRSIYHQINDTLEVDIQETEATHIHYSVATGVGVFLGVFLGVFFGILAFKCYRHKKQLAQQSEHESKDMNGPSSAERLTSQSPQCP